jgi:hypothetical protein
MLEIVAFGNYLLLCIGMGYASKYLERKGYLIW